MIYEVLKPLFMLAMFWKERGHDVDVGARTLEHCSLT
jgi:hypothetical protein